MAKVDLKSMALDELKKLHKDVAAAIDGFHARQREEARSVLEAKARELGFNLSEFVPGGGRRGGKAKASPPKYRHPENPDLTWSGRGRRPNWVTAALEQGKSLEDLAI